MIQVGTKVVCVDAMFDARSIALIPNRPKKDLVYTVREIIEHPEVAAIGLLLNEITNPELKHATKGHMFEPTFSINRFVPLDWEIKEDDLVKEKEYEAEGIL